MSGANKIIIPAALVAVLGAAWVGGGIYAGGTVEEKIKALTAPPVGRSAVKLENLNHKKGLISSSGTVDLVFEDTCTPGSGRLTVARVEYNVSHLPMPGSAARFDWKLVPQGEVTKAFTTLFGEKGQIGGEGTASFSGDLKSEWRIPEIAVKDGGGQVSAPVSTGHVALTDKTLALDWKLDKLSGKGGEDGQNVEIKQVGVDVNLVDRKLGTGKFSFGVDSISSPQGIIEGYKLGSEAVEQGDRLNIEVHQSLKKLQVAGKNAKDLAIDFAIKGLNTKSFVVISKLANDSCGFKDINADQTNQVRAAARTLLTQGFSVAVPNLKGTTDEGSVDGQASVELLPVKGDANAPIQLVNQLKSSGKLTVKGTLIPQEQKDQALATGYIIEEGGALSTNFELVGGVLKVVGKEFDPEMVKMALSNVDVQLNALLSGKPPVPVEAPAPAAPPAEAPAAAPAAPAQAK